MLEIFSSEAAERAADRVVLAYELADTLGAYAGDSLDRQAEALNVMQIVAAFCLQHIGMKEKGAVDVYTKTFSNVRRMKRRIGGHAKLSDVLVEMSLDQTR